MSETTYTKYSKCPTCSQSVSKQIVIASLPKSAEVLCVPNDDEHNTWSVTLTDYRNDNTTEFTASNMKDVRWFIENVAIKLHRPEHRFSVVFPTSRYDRHSRISKIEFNEWADENLKVRKNRTDWYSKLVSKATKDAVRGSNVTSRLGYSNHDVE